MMTSELAPPRGVKYMTFTPPRRARVYLADSQIELVDHTNMGVVNEDVDGTVMFKVGDYYTLSSVACDGFEGKTKTYELVAIVDKFYDVDIDSVVVKQVDGDKGTVFTLSKNDCNFLGIDYEKGLQMFPISLNWKHVERTVIPFDKNNLGSVPLSKVDGTVRHILIKLKGFKWFHDHVYMLTPEGSIVLETDFVTSLSVSLKKPLVCTNDCYAQSLSLNKGALIKHRIVMPNGITFPRGGMISTENEIFILLELKSSSDDFFLGVQRQHLDGIKVSDMFSVSWECSPRREEYVKKMVVDEFQAQKGARNTKLHEEIADILLLSRRIRAQADSISNRLRLQKSLARSIPYYYWHL